MKRSIIFATIISIIMSVNIPALAAPSPSPSPSPKITKTEEKKDSANSGKATSSPTADKDDKSKSDSSKKSDADTKSDSKKKSDDSESDNSSENKSEFPVPHAKSAIVLDAYSGDVIYALNCDDKMYPAGTSNIMTAIIALENKNLADVCTVTDEALADITYDQPQMGLKPGETYTIEQLLYAILVNSNNDAANTLAIAVSGSIDAFVQKMNDKAVELGLTKTHFANPSGKQDKNHCTTAADLAKLAQYAMKNSTFMKIASTQKYTFPATSVRTSEKTILSTNHLISRYKYPYHYYANATGIKSGNSADAGYCLVASAVKNGFNVLSVVMGCENTDVKDGAYSFTDTAKIFDYVFENYQSTLLVKKGDVIYDSKVSEAKNSTRLALTVEEDIYATLKKSADPELITNEVKITEQIKAPITQGQYFGTVTYSYNGHELRTASVVAANEVKRDFILHIINSLLHFIFNPIVLIIIIFIFAIWAKMRIDRNRKRRIRHSRMVSHTGTGARKPQSSQRSTSRRTASPKRDLPVSSPAYRRKNTDYTNRRK